MDYNKISVVVPCLNEERYIRYFLESLVRQYYQNFEVVFVDGGSRDRTVEIAESYRDRLRVRVVVFTKRNFGAIRNTGHFWSEGNVVLQSNADNVFPPQLLGRLNREYQDERTIAVTGRVHPIGTSIFAYFAYPVFDLLRWFFASLPRGGRKFRPSGSFLSYRRDVWRQVGKFPEVTVNEDGLFGAKMDMLKGRIVFWLDLSVGHFVKKFEDWGGIRAIFFYLYVLGNHFPMLKPLLAPIERRAGEVFSGKRKV